MNLHYISYGNNIEMKNKTLNGPQLSVPYFEPKFRASLLAESSLLQNASFE
jgi:hypothetical protein